jgi:hypothetical protein
MVKHDGNDGERSQAVDVSAVSACRHFQLFNEFRGAPAVAKSDTPDDPAVPKGTGAPTYELSSIDFRLECRQIIPRPVSPPEPPAMQARDLQYPGKHGLATPPQQNRAAIVVSARR